MLRPSVFCDLASRPRSLSSRPSAGAISSSAGAAGSGSAAAGSRIGFTRHDRRLGQLYVCDGPLRCVARDGGIIADGGQPAGVDPFDRLSGR